MGSKDVVATSWTEIPAPWEGKLPPVGVTPATAADAGCWVDGVRGIYAPVAAVDIAVARGWPINAQDSELLEWARAGQLGEGPDGYGPEAWGEVVDDVTDWLTDHVAPEGYLFEWIDGDLMLWSDEQSCEASGDRCMDVLHTHNAVPR